MVLTRGFGLDRAFGLLRRIDCYRNPLTTAAFQNDESKVGELLERGLPVDSRTWVGETALSIAALQGHTALVRLLLRWSADPLGPTGRPLCNSIEAGHLDVLD